MIGVHIMILLSSILIPFIIQILFDCIVLELDFSRLPKLDILVIEWILKSTRRYLLVEAHIV